MKTKNTDYDFPAVGCYVDESAGSADDCNRRTIELAECYGFESGNPSGCFDGLRGLEISMSVDDAESASHQGECFEDVECLVAKPEISSQLDAIGDDKIRLALKESGGWGADELTDNEANRNRAVWMAACDIRENLSEWLSEVGDDAVSFLNDLETRSHMYWTFEDNSLFLMADVDGAREECEFVSSKEQDYPPDDYTGEWLHVSDHGNATLYVRENGKDREVWAVV
jgi:hypothetical protein